MRKHYSTDLNDLEWQRVRRCIPPAKPGGRPYKWPMREIFDAIPYEVHAGGAWRLLPGDFPPWQTIYHYFRLWREQGIWQRIYKVLHRQIRRQAGRKPKPTAGIIDRQSVKTTDRGSWHGFDGAKKVNGRKRHMVVDVMGFPIFLSVHAADMTDRESAPVKMTGAKQSCATLKLVWADAGYRGKLIEWRAMF